MDDATLLNTTDSESTSTDHVVPVKTTVWEKVRSALRRLPIPSIPIFSALDKLTVRATLRLGFMSVVVGALVIGAFSLYQMHRINAASQAIYEKEFAISQAAEQVRSYMLRASRAETQLLTSSAVVERKTLSENAETSLVELEKRMALINKLSTDEESADVRKRLDTSIGKFAKRLRAYVEMMKTQSLDYMQLSPDVGIEDAGLLNDARKLDKIIDEMLKLRAAAAEASLIQSVEIYKTSIKWVIGITAALVVFAIGVAGWVTARLMRQLGGEPVYAKEIASRIARGDLSMHIALEKDDSSSVLFSLHEMQYQLAQTMGEIADTSKQVANASREISMGNLDLSHRTEQQSSSLEKTTTNVEQMAAIAKRYSESATQAAQLSVQASNAAKHGGETMLQVAGTMENISQTTRAIYSNISVIEGIAFRTNILALNAAVEAAHAGELGRGFAVVAAEVRDLAQRSASAARDINSLIEKSVQQVKEGSILAKSAGQTISDMAQTVQQVSTVMEEISSSSAEQREGIEEINRAMSQLDEGTQQNAALVEESAAAAQSLDDQAQMLDQLVGRFSLKGDAI
jgi:methyl-accepting chemotaxis protein